MVGEGGRARLAQMWRRGWAGLLVVALAAGCSSAAPTLVPIITPTAAPSGSSSGSGGGSGVGLVTASGMVVPAQQAALGVAVAGVVETLTVKAGDAVPAGQGLVQLQGSEQLAANVARAQQGIAAAQQTLAAAQQTLAAAQQAGQDAQQAVLEARRAITALTESTAAALNLAQVQATVANTQKQIDDAQRTLYSLTTPDLKWYRDQLARAQDSLTITLQTAGMTDLQMAVTTAQDAVARRAIDLTDAKNREGWGGAKPVLDAQKNYDLAVETLQNAQLRLAQAQIANGNAITDAQKKVDDAQKALTGAQQPDTLKVNQAQANLSLLQAQLAKAQHDVVRLKASQGVDPDLLQTAQDRLVSAQNQMLAVQAGMVTAQAGVTAAQTGVTAAEAALTAAQAALDQLSLTAPFAGTAVEVNVVPGAVVVPGQEVIRLGDLQHLQIETTDLSEKDVNQVHVGQAATIYVQALQRDVPGQVTEIATEATKLGGDVVYAVKLEMTNPPAGLRWGMSVKVNFAP